MTMFISPSKILYCNCLDLGALNDVSPDKDIIDVSDTLRRGARYPKLQVVKKDGFYFTLNDTKLKLYRHMEAIGQCGSVKVEKVPIREVPEGIRTLMKVPENVLTKSNRGRSSKQKNAKYQSIDSQEGKPSLLSTSSETSSESEVSSDEDSGDPSDWTDEEPSGTDVDSSEDDEEDEANESFI